MPLHSQLRYMVAKHGPWKKSGRKFILFSCGEGGNSYKLCGQQESPISKSWRESNQPLVRSQNHQTVISLLQPRDEKPILGRRVSGHTGQGRPRTHWLDIIEQDTNLTIAAIKEAVNDRHGEHWSNEWPRVERNWTDRERGWKVHVNLFH